MLPRLPVPEAESSKGGLSEAAVKLTCKMHQPDRKISSCGIPQNPAPVGQGLKSGPERTPFQSRWAALFPDRNRQLHCLPSFTATP